MIDITAADGTPHVAFMTVEDKAKLYVGTPINGDTTCLSDVILIAIQGGWGTTWLGWHDAARPQTDYRTEEEALSSHGYSINWDNWLTHVRSNTNGT